MTKREKILIGAFLVSAGVFLFLKFILFPVQEKGSEIYSQMKELENRIEVIKGQSSSNKDRVGEIQNLKKEIDRIGSKYFQSYREEELGTEIINIVKKANIDVSRISVKTKKTYEEILESSFKDKDDVSPLEEAYEKVKEEFGDGREKAEKKSDTWKIKIPRIDMSFTFEGTFSDMERLVRLIEEEEKKMFINSISMNTVDESGILTCGIELSVLIGPLPKEEEKSKPILHKERKDFFGESEFVYKSEEDGEYDEDLFIILKPTSSDISSVIMGLNDKLKESNVTGDANKPLQGFIHIFEKEGEIFASYGVGERRYPLDGEIKLQCKNDDVIYMKVISSKRNEGDFSSIELSVINESKRKFIYTVEEDDKDSRFKVVKMEGMVESLEVDKN